MRDLLFKTQYKLFMFIYGEKQITVETIEMSLRIFQPTRVRGYNAVGNNSQVLVFLPSLIETEQWAKILVNNLEKDEKVSSLFYNCKAQTVYVYDWVNTIEGHSKEDYLGILVDLKSHLQRVVAYMKNDSRKSIASQINHRVLQSQLTNIAVLIDSLNQCSL